MEIRELSGELARKQFCIDCVRAVKVCSADEIEEGDHIVFAGAVYDHHGIVVKKGPEPNKFKVVEASNTRTGIIFDMVRTLFRQKANLVASTKILDFEKEQIRVVRYREEQFSKAQIVDRANRFVGNPLYEYNLFQNNCEHFATFCVTGCKLSIQVSKIALTYRLFFGSGLNGISDERERNKREYENEILCKKCFKYKEYLLDVKVRPIDQGTEIRKGDIVRYSYWNLWHDAIVLEIRSRDDTCIKCTISHYAFCGPFSRRTIKEENLKIAFDGKTFLVDYNTSPIHSVYPEHVVVERARRRLGEQEFVFFVNDSSHFARWCKLKHKRLNQNLNPSQCKSSKIVNSIV